jgi:hypothetical protein
MLVAAAAQLLSVYAGYGPTSLSKRDWQLLTPPTKKPPGHRAWKAWLTG